MEANDIYLQILIAVVGSAIIPAVGFAVYASWLLKECIRRLMRLEEMHERPEDFRFGTEVTNRLLEQIIRIQVWQCEEMVGKPLPDHLKPQFPV